MLSVEPTDAVTLAPLERFRRIVMADPALQLELSQPIDPRQFAALATARAAGFGISLTSDDVARALQPDPLRLARWLAPGGLSRDPPPVDWLPVHIGNPAPLWVDFCHFAGAPLAEPFFEDSIRAAQARPFNRLFSHRMSLDDFLAQASRGETRAPDGLIFHMSRCGSTLVAQMLAATGATTVSEAPPIDVAVQIETSSARGRHPGVLAAVVSALGRRRGGRDDYFVKLDSWHVLALARFRHVFPATPWVFLYRDPIEVLVSQMRQRGMQTIPGGMSPHIYGLDPTAMPDDEYCARVLALTCEAAAQAGLGGGLMVNYDELPDAVFTRILPHFGVMLDETSRLAMDDAARRNAKAPHFDFAPDAAAKRAEAKPRLIELAERHLAEPYRRLEALRAAQAAG
jgi:hypothetical protein